MRDLITPAFEAAKSLEVEVKQAAPWAPITNIGGGADHRPEFSHAAVQYAHNRGWVFAASRLASSRIAAQPIYVARKRRGRGKGNVSKGLLPIVPKQYARIADRLEILDQHPLLSALNDPHEFLTKAHLIYFVVQSLILSGRSLLWDTTLRGRRQILPIPSHWVEGYNAGVSWRIRPRLSNSETAKAIDVPSEEMVQVIEPDVADPLGGAKSTVSAVATSVLTDEAITDTQLRTFKQGMFGLVAITIGDMLADPSTGQAVQPELTPEQRNQLAFATVQAYRGAVKYGDPIILDRLIKDISRKSLSPAELEFAQSERGPKERILEVIGISEILLGHTQNANRAGAAVAERVAVANCFNPIISRTNDALQAWLAPRYSSEGEELVVWIQECVPSDPEMEAGLWKAAVTAGHVSINEDRARLGLDPVEGGDEVPALTASINDPGVRFLSRRLNGYTLAPTNGQS